MAKLIQVGAYIIGLAVFVLGGAGFGILGNMNLSLISCLLGGGIIYAGNAYSELLIRNQRLESELEQAVAEQEQK